METDPKKSVNVRKEWEKVCQDSKGKRVMLTGTQETDGKEFQALLQLEFERTMEYNKLHAIFEHAKDNFFFKLRTELEAAGMKDVWEKGLAFDQNAKTDGILVINISESQ